MQEKGLFDIVELLGDAPSSRLEAELRYFAVTLDSAFKYLYLVFISDPHYGSPWFDEARFLYTRDCVKKVPPLFVVLTGDLCESTIKSSKGEIFKQVGTPANQRDKMIEWLIPIKHKVLGMTDGNHERRISNETSVDITSDIAKALGVPYRPDGIMLKISFGDGNKSTPGRPYTYYTYSTHGYGGARTKSAKAVKVERQGQFIVADLHTMSHDHVVNIAPDVILRPDDRTSEDKKTGFTTGRVKAVRKMLVKTSCYLKWGGYGEAGGFPPCDLATPVIKLRGTGDPRIYVGV